MSLQEFINQYQQRWLRVVIPLLHGKTDRLHQAMEYALLVGGKRLRPLLVYGAGKLFAVSDEQLDIPAAAVELIHTYSLIHDDLPAMDDDALRRGKPACHIAFDDATAILAGDALQCLAFQLLTETHHPLSLRTKMQLTQGLAKAIGSQGMAGGQMLDLLAENKPLDLEQLNTIHHLKTGALITAALQMGACISDQCQTDTLVLLERFGYWLGLGFQIRDDILDVTASTEQLGKPQGSDENKKKLTYPSLLGLEEAEKQTQHCYEQSLYYLQQIPGDTHLLQQLSKHLIYRQH